MKDAKHRLVAAALLFSSFRFLSPLPNHSPPRSCGLKTVTRLSSFTTINKLTFGSKVSTAGAE